MCLPLYGMAFAVCCHSNYTPPEMPVISKTIKETPQKPVRIISLDTAQTVSLPQNKCCIYLPDGFSIHNFKDKTEISCASIGKIIFETRSDTTDFLFKVPSSRNSQTKFSDTLSGRPLQMRYFSCLGIIYLQGEFIDHQSLIHFTCFTKSDQLGEREQQINLLYSIVHSIHHCKE